VYTANRKRRESTEIKTTTGGGKGKGREIDSLPEEG